MQFKPTTSRIASAAAFLAAGGAKVACAAEAGAHHYPGISGDLVFWSIVTFVVFVLAIRKLGWSNFVSGLNTRGEREAALVAEAEKTHRDAQQVVHEHTGRLEAVDETIREMLAEAQRDAQHTRQEILEVARHEAETLRQRARREIQRTRDQALDGIFDTLTSRVAEATQRRLASRMGPADHQRLIDEALSQFESQRA